nr:MAG TPA: hypothetical protein [Caudoviricetes sp.]
MFSSPSVRAFPVSNHSPVFPLSRTCMRRALPQGRGRW